MYGVLDVMPAGMVEVGGPWYHGSGATLSDAKVSWYSEVNGYESE